MLLNIPMERAASKVFIIGGRRGLGKAISNAWKKEYPQDQVLISSRKPEADILCDLSREDDVTQLLRYLDEQKPERVFCVAGGGPYGSFLDKSWKDHQWALNVTLISPLRIAHHYLQQSYSQQMVFVGSSIAESLADPKAASYSAAKHGLLGLTKTLALETSKDVRLFSPPYMATEMLPPNPADKLHQKVYEPEQIARDFVQWAYTPAQQLQAVNTKAAWHKTYTS